METKPQTEHEWLQRLVGEWTAEMEYVMGPSQPPMKSRGAESVRSIGGLWTLGEGSGEMPDGGRMMKYQDIMTLVSDDHRILASRIQGDDGSWTGFMTAHYRRKT